MTETLPAWLWIPGAVLAWGYLALDAVARRLNHQSTERGSDDG